jgi:ferrochelatase
METTRAPQTPDRPDTAIIWCNIGTPDAPTVAAVRRYLAEFLGDPRIVELPRLPWMAILHGIVLRIRPTRSAAKYASIWTRDGSPLHVWTERQAKLLQGWLGHHGHRVVVAHAMRYGQPSIGQTIDHLTQEGISRILVLPAYPQYSGTTTASLVDSVFSWSRRARHLPEWRFVNNYHQHPSYVRALAGLVQQHWQRHGRGPMLLMSFHGIPEHACRAGDPYAAQCHTTARLLAEQLGMPAQQYRVTFQSRFGQAKWLQPATTATLQQLAREGIGRVDVFCPGFVADCLETLEEIARENHHAFLAAGGSVFHYINCLNDSTEWIDALGAISTQHLSGWIDTPSKNPQASGYCPY